MAGGFVALAIMLGIGTSILGGGGIQDCVGLPGAPYAGSSVTAAQAAAAANLPGQYTADQSTYSGASTTGTALGLAGSWAETCAENSSRAQAGYTLLLVALIVMAAAIVLVVVRMLTG